MDEKKYELTSVILALLLTLLVTACGTLTIETESSTSEPEATTAPMVPEDEVTSVITEVSPPTEDADGAEETTQPSTGDSEITEVDETWNLFTDYHLGFSIKFPKEMATFRGSCTWNEGEGSYRPETALVPVKIFEDSNAVYIAAAHYYELAGERQEGGRTFYDECNLITNTLALLQDPDHWNEPYWKLVVAEVGDDGELDTFIKERYGAGCSLGEQSAAEQEGVYDVAIQGDGKDLEETQCPLNFVTVVKYFPADDKVVAWDRGQSYYFPADVNYAVTYDQEMEDSFRFLTDTSTGTAATGSTQDGPGAGLATYVNDEYGFSLNYPSTWTVAEVNNSGFVGPGSRSVQLTQGTATLVIGYRRSGEDRPIMGSGAAAGDLEARGTVPVLNQNVTRYVLVYEGKDKAVFYFSGELGAVVSAGGLEFAPRMDDRAPVAYETLELSPLLQAEADSIVSSITLTP